MVTHDIDIPVHGGFLGNGIRGVQGFDHINRYAFVLQGKDAIPGASYQIIYRRADGKQFIVLPEGQTHDLSTGTVRLKWTPSVTFYACPGRIKVQLLACDASEEIVWYSHVGVYTVSASLPQDKFDNIEGEPDIFANQVALAVDSATNAKQSEENAKQSELNAKASEDVSKRLAHDINEKIFALETMSLAIEEDGQLYLTRTDGIDSIDFEMDDENLYVVLIDEDIPASA